MDVAGGARTSRQAAQPCTCSCTQPSISTQSLTSQRYSCACLAVCSTHMRVLLFLCAFEHLIGSQEVAVPFRAVFKCYILRCMSWEDQVLL